MSFKKIALLLAMALTGAAVFAGCGGDDSSDSESEALTKTELVAQADEICQGANDAVEEGTADFDQTTSDDELIAFAEDTYVPELQSELSELQELTPPEEDADAYAAMLSSLEDGINTVEDNPELVTQEDAEDPFADATEQAKELGLTVCGQS